MLLFENLLEYVIEHMKVADIFRCLPFKWNPKQKRFQHKNKRDLLIYKVRLFTNALFVLLAFLQASLLWKKVNIFVKIHTIFCLAGHLTFSYSHWVFYSKTQMIISYLNGMLSHENNMKGKSSSN